MVKPERVSKSSSKPTTSPGLTAGPSSSCSSRMAQASASSPSCSRPPGSAIWPACRLISDVRWKIGIAGWPAPSSRTIATAAGFSDWPERTRSKPRRFASRARRRLRRLDAGDRALDRARIALAPLSTLDRGQEPADHFVENVWVLEIDGVARARQDRQAGRRDRALEHQGRLKAAFVLVPGDDE